ncbi:MAG: TetR family transcriptional regulator [Clostridia bacterium]|jgi:AcrR family transcriptional regulator|nr:TetR family transcriptional regulator [Clostridia bacterium]
MSNKNETQKRILETAIRIFAAKGYNGTTTAEIAKEASVAEGTVFKHYKTKKQLLRAILEYIIHEIVPAVMQKPFEGSMLGVSEAEVKKVMKQKLMEKVEFISKNISCIKIIVNEIQFHEDLKNEYLGQLVPDFIKYMEGIYRMGVQRGVFRDIDPHTAVRSFVGMLALLVLDKNVLNKELDISKEFDNIFELYLNGVLEKRESNG